MKVTKTKAIPEFKTLEESRQYREVRGPLAEGKKGRVNRPKSDQKRSSFLAIRLAGEEFTRLRDLAAGQGLGPSTFARFVLTAAVKKGTKPSTGKKLEEVFGALENNLSLQTKENNAAIQSYVRRQSTLFLGFDGPEQDR